MHAQALRTPFSELVSFGDSYSDNGFVDGHGYRRYTNTWTWVEYLAQLLGLPDNNWASGGAMSNERNQAHPPGASWSGLAWQVREYLNGSAGRDQSRVLFTIMCGSNDYWGGQLSGTVAAQNLRSAMEALIAGGARHILFRETTTVLLSPGYLSGAWAGDGPGWKQLVDDLNAETRVIIQHGLPVDHPEVKLYYLSSDPLFSKIRASEAGYEFEIIDRFWLGSYDYPYPHKYLWWDEWHPMGEVHLMMAEEALAALRDTLIRGDGEYLPNRLNGNGPVSPALLGDVPIRQG
jgi:phospholipase/lecithinase/hemolysin